MMALERNDKEREKQLLETVTNVSKQALAAPAAAPPMFSYHDGDEPIAGEVLEVR
jgi:hypothetical protein